LSYSSQKALESNKSVVDKRESHSRPDAGVVFFEHWAINQRQELVARVRRAGLMRKKPV
jgi:acyl dehydratase